MTEQIDFISEITLHFVDKSVSYDFLIKAHLYIKIHIIGLQNCLSKIQNPKFTIRLVFFS